MPFPCYRVSARFDAGMSGGPGFDKYGSLCGLVCANVDSSHQSTESISCRYDAPALFTLIVDGCRGDNYPRGVRYPAIEPARDGQIQVVDRSKLIDWLRHQWKQHT